MTYTKQTWVDGVTPIDAEHLNHMEDGIESASNKTIYVTIYEPISDVSELIEAARNGANIIGVLYDENTRIYSSVVDFNENRPNSVFEFEFYNINGETGNITINSVSLSESGIFSREETGLNTGGVYNLTPNTFSYKNIMDAIQLSMEIVLKETETDPMPGGASSVVGTRRRRLTWYGNDGVYYYATFDNEVGFSSSSYDGIMTEY